MSSATDVSQSGVHYFMRGFDLIKTKGLKRFVFIPLTVNLLLFASAFYWLFSHLNEQLTRLQNWLPEWLSWLNWLLWPLAVISALIVFSLLFNTLTNWLAAPFNGLLSEKVERHLTGQSLGDDGLLAIVKDIPRTLGREATKLIYYLPRALVFLLGLLFLPVLGQILWFAFTAWMMAIQYCDYPFDNHKVPFGKMRGSLGEKRMLSFSFGAAATLFAMIPVINFLVMPVAICGATAMWVDHHRQHH